MKKVLVVLTLVLGTLVSNAQLREVTPISKLGEIKRGGFFIADITYSGKGGYTLSYWDASYTTIDVINSISFDATDEELVTLKKIFKEQCAAEKKAEKTFGLGNNMITIRTDRAFGLSGLTIYITGTNHKTGFFRMAESELDKLFGK